MKLDILSIDESSDSSVEGTEAVVNKSGYRLVNLKGLSSVLSSAQMSKR